VLLGLLAAGLSAAAASGLFYLRNVHLTGNLLGAQFGYLPARVPRPIADVAVDPDVWRQWHAIYGYGSGVIPITLVLVALPLAVGTFLGARHLLRGRAAADWYVALMISGLVLGIVVMQLQYVATGGGAAWRYLLPTVPVLSLAIAVTASAAKRARVLVLSCWLCVALIPLAMAIHRSLAAPYGRLQLPLTGVDPASTGPVHGAAAWVCLALGLASTLVSVAAGLRVRASTAPVDARRKVSAPASP
jgi:hypothetical protein